MKHLLRTSAIVAATILAVGATGAVAAKLITSKDIKNQTIKGKDVRPGSLKEKHLSEQTVEDLQGQQGAAGPAGAKGDTGAAGKDAAYVGAHWSVISRNTIGSARADLQGGPFVPGSSPPYGEGSLGLGVSNDALTGGTPQEKAAFGNEVDFLGDPVSGLADVGFQVVQTGENIAISPGNLPNVTFEIDPNLVATPSNFSSMVFLPDPVATANVWSPYIDATTTGMWFLTGAAGTETGCNQATTCTFADLQTALADGDDEATTYTAAVSKGRDSAWVGAVDGFRINSTVYDFEPLGVAEVSPY